MTFGLVLEKMSWFYLGPERSLGMEDAIYAKFLPSPLSHTSMVLNLDYRMPFLVIIHINRQRSSIHTVDARVARHLADFWCLPESLP